MRSLRLLAPALVLMGAFVVCSTTSYGKPEYTKKEKKACNFCHLDSKAKPKDLTDAGKFYKEHNNSLEGYKK